ncbi:MAG: TerB family tellurite resistance protein [Pseudomonadales bacterium]|nr:TerB family tellurite resistance protein [Pseudomonadales bacterium]
MFQLLKQLFSQPDASQAVSSQHLAELAATALLIEVSHADHDIDPQELQAILAIAQQAFALADDEIDRFFTQAELKKSEATSLYEFTDVVNRHFDKAQKFQLIVDCWRVAFADGKLQRHEDHTVRKIAELIYVSHAEFIRAKHKAAAQQNRGLASGDPHTTPS